MAINNITEKKNKLRLLYDSIPDAFNSTNSFYIESFDDVDETFYKITPFQKKVILNLICNRNNWYQCEVLSEMWKKKMLIQKIMIKK